MEIQLLELIEQIKKDGVDAAEEKAAEILNSAKAQAEKIISDAKLQADALIANAKAENEKTVKSGEDALRQAGRNLLISFRESVARELKAIIDSNVNKAFSSEDFTKLIITAVESRTKNPEAEDLSVLLSSDDLNKLEEALLSLLKEKMLGGVTLKATDSFDGGFRISADKSGAYYDFSSEAVTDMLSAYLSPKVTALLKEAENNG